jgi:hypothetical protein
MPGARAFASRFPAFPVFAGISLVSGLLVPTLFEWSEEPAARTRHTQMERAALMVFLVTMVVIILSWYRYNPSTSDRQVALDAGSQKFQFGLRGLLAAIALAGVLLAVAPYLHRTVASAAVIVTAISVLSWSLFRGWQNRSRISALLASMYLPFFWMVLYNRPFGHASGLIEWLPLGPAIVCAAFAGG